MTMLFDFLAVGCFLAMVAAFFFLTDRDNRTLLHFLVAGVVFAVANQVGNSGSTLLGAILLVAGAAYVVLNVMHPRRQ